MQLLSRNALRATAMRRIRDACNCSYMQLHCYKCSDDTQGIRNNDRFLSTIDIRTQYEEKFMMSRVTKFVINYR